MFDFVKKKKKKQKLVILGESMLKKPLVKKKKKSKKAKIKFISSIALKDDQVQKTQKPCNYTL